MVDVTIIKLVLNTLDGIEIKGRTNIEAMLGCINALESFVQNVEAENKKEKEVVSNG